MTATEARYCLTCDYDLRGLPENRCPECGRQFDPVDGRTFAVTQAPNRFVRVLRRHPGWWMHAGAISLVAAALLASLVPGGWCLFLCYCLLGWPVLAAIGVGRLIGCALVRLRDHHPRRLPGSAWGWLVAPVCCIMSVGLLASDTPSRQFFRINRPFLDSFVRSTAAIPPGSRLPDRWLGCYPAERIETMTGGVRFLVRGAGFLDSYGFAYCSQACPNGDSNDHYYPLTGNWYLWREDF